MLHVTNGDGAAEGLRRAALPGRVAVSCDVLHDGPAPAVPDDEWYHVRAQYLAALGFDDPARAASEAIVREIRSGLVAADAVLDAAADDDEVVLWFEHDLFDQLLLVRLLARIARWQSHRARLTLVCTERYLGPLSPETLAALFPARRPITPEQLALGVEAWAAFRSADPRAIERVLAGNTAPLPFLAGALRRQLEEFPSVRDGLSRTERDILELAHGAPQSPRELFPAQQAREERIFMGDVSFWWRLRALAGADPPLLALEMSETSRRGLPHGNVRVTPFGREVLERRADRVERCGIDRWYGGVHMQGRRPAWRWDSARGRLSTKH